MDARFERGEDLVPVAAFYRHDEGKLELGFVGLVQLGEALKLFGRALVNTGASLFIGAGFGQLALDGCFAGQVRVSVDQCQLAGVIGALLAQGMTAFEAACLAVWLHARAGEQQGQLGRGLAASDLIPAIRQLLEEHAPCTK